MPGDPTSSVVNNTPIAFSPGALASARLTYAKKGFEATLWNQYVGKQYLSNEGLKAHSLPAYHIINARTSYTWNCSDMQRLVGFVEFRNLGNTSYAANGHVGRFCVLLRTSDFQYYDWFDLRILSKPILETKNPRAMPAGFLFDFIPPSWFGEFSATLL